MRWCNPGGQGQEVKQPLPLPKGVSNLAVGGGVAPMTATPEPETWLLAGLLLALAGMRFRFAHLVNLEHSTCAFPHHAGAVNEAGIWPRPVAPALARTARCWRWAGPVCSSCILARPTACNWPGCQPTAALVALLSGLEFVSHGVEGFHNAARNVLIAPACSGINFLAICLVTGALPGLMRLRSLAGQLGWLLLIAASAYLLTLLVNTARILLAIELLQLDVYGELLTHERLHRVEGVVIYYLFLCFFSAALSTMLNPAPAGQKGRAAVFAGLLPLGPRSGPWSATLLSPGGCPCSTGLPAAPWPVCRTRPHGFVAALAQSDGSWRRALLEQSGNVVTTHNSARNQLYLLPRMEPPQLTPSSTP